MQKTLSERIYKSHVKSCMLQTFSPPARPCRYATWEDESMIKAMKTVDTGVSIRHAATTHGVPKSTLCDRVTGRVQHGVKSGPDPYLSRAEEDELVNFLLRCASVGYAHTRSEVLVIVNQILELKGVKRNVTNGWWDGFKKRHPTLSLRTAVPLSVARATAMDRETLDLYYDILESTLKDNDLLDNPCAIFNCDETGMPLHSKSPKVVSHVKEKNPSYVTSEMKKQVTVLACASAAGQCIPPFVIFDRKTLSPELAKGEVHGTGYGLSSNGWIDQELFLNWFLHHFLAYAPSIRPLLLLMDGHLSHFCPDFIKIAAEEKVLVFVLPPNTTHLCQPLDKGPFSPLKAQWKKCCHNFSVKYPGRVVTLYDFSSVFSKAWFASMTMNNIITGFRITGVYPINRRAFLLPEESSIFRPESLSERSGLSYIPLYSPARVQPSVSSFFSPEPSMKRSISQPCLDHSALSDTLDTSFTEKCCLLENPGTISKFLKVPEPFRKLPEKRPKHTGRVLTSKANLEMLEERKRKKEEEARVKEERKKAREDQKKAREDQKKAQKKTRRRQEKTRRRQEKTRRHEKARRKHKMRRRHKKARRRHEMRRRHEKARRRHEKARRKHKMRRRHEKARRRHEMRRRHEKARRRHEMRRRHEKARRRHKMRRRHEKARRRHEMRRRHEKARRRHEKARRRHKMRRRHEKARRRHEKARRRHKMRRRHEKARRRHKMRRRHEKARRRHEMRRHEKARRRHEKARRRHKMRKRHEKARRRHKMRKRHEKARRRHEMRRRHEKARRRHEKARRRHKMRRRHEKARRRHKM